MGGYLASFYASSHPEIERLVLLAPAFSLSSRWPEMLGAGKFSAWRESGSMEVFHYAENCPRNLSFDLYDDACRYPSYPDFAQPARIYHGIHDDTVPVELSRHFAGSHPNAQLIELDSDHELIGPLSRIVQETIPFLLG
jgi:pimeloyl-ACP methyl ester carboxylesterase